MLQQDTRETRVLYTHKTGAYGALVYLGLSSLDAATQRAPCGIQEKVLLLYMRHDGKLTALDIHFQGEEDSFARAHQGNILI